MSSGVVAYLATKQATPRLYFECRPNGNSGLHVEVMGEGWETPNAILGRDALKSHIGSLEPVDPEETPFVRGDSDE